MTKLIPPPFPILSFRQVPCQFQIDSICCLNKFNFYFFTMQEMEPDCSQNKLALLLSINYHSLFYRFDNRIYQKGILFRLTLYYMA